jgi:hypothetical protein
MAPSFHHYTRNCQYQPFMTIYRTDGSTAQQIQEQNKRDWTSKSEDNVVMRTASFRHGLNDLEVCAREEDYVSFIRKNKTVVERREMIGLEDDTVIPLGLLAVLRRQMKREGGLIVACS